MIRQDIENLIKKAIKQAQKSGKLPEFKIPEILIEYPEQEKFGDYSANIAMRIAGVVKKEPLERLSAKKNK